MAAYVIDSELFRDQFGTAAMREIFSDRTTVQRWLDVEAALAKVQGEMNIIPAAAAKEIQRKCQVDNINLAKLKEEMDRTSHPIVPLLRAMKPVCEGDAGEYIHWGATTQDIMDTGTVLQIRDGLDLIEASYRDLYNNTRELARKYRDQVMVGRTHGQQALPITFGFKAAGWAEELRRNYQRLRQVRDRVLVGQFSGAVGTLSALGDAGIEVQDRLFKELELDCPIITWHTSRDSYAELISMLAIACGTAGKIAHEIFSLQKTETAELEEPFATGKVGSSTMPHKRNPPICEGVMAVNRVVRSTVGLAIEGIVSDHERDKVVLQTEREYISKVFCMTHAVVSKMAFATGGLSVRTENMERNLFTQKGLLMSEAVMMGISEALGRQEAHEIVYEICMEAFESDTPLKDALMKNSQVTKHLSEQDIDRLLSPHEYLGHAATFVDRVLAQSLD